MRSHAADRPASVACAPSPCRRRLCWTRPPRVPHDRPNVPPSTIGYWTPNSCVILVFMTCLREACLRAGFYVSNVADCRRWWHPTAGRQLPASANSRSRPGRARRGPTSRTSIDVDSTPAITTLWYLARADPLLANRVMRQDAEKYRAPTTRTLCSLPIATVLDRATSDLASSQSPAC
jgi:hypothetical protein